MTKSTDEIPACTCPKPKGKKSGAHDPFNPECAAFGYIVVPSPHSGNQ